MHATLPVVGHPLGDGTASLFDVLSLVSAAAACEASSPVAASNISIRMDDSLLTADGSAFASGAASIGTLYAAGGDAGILVGKPSGTEVVGISLVAQDSVLSAIGGSGGSAVLSVYGASGLPAPGLNVSFAVMSVNATTALAHRLGGGSMLCGVLTIRCDSGAAVALLTVWISSNSTLASTADVDGWVGTASVLSSDGSASLTASRHWVSASSLSAVAGLQRSTTTKIFVGSVAATLSVVAGMCALSAAVADSLRWAVWGELNETATKPLLLPSSLLLLAVVVTASNLTATVGGRNVAAVLSVVMYSDVDCGFYSSNGLSRLGAIPPALDGGEPTKNNASTPPDETGSATATTTTSPANAMTIVVTNGSHLTASTSDSFALVLSSGLGWGSGTAQWSAVGPAALVALTQNSTAMATAYDAMALSMAVGAYYNDNSGRGAVAVYYTVAGAALVAVTRNSTAATAAYGMAISMATGVYNNIGGTSVAVYYTVEGAALVAITHYSAATASASNYMALSVAAGAYNNNGATAVAVCYTITGAAVVAVTRNGTAAATASYVALSMAAGIANHVESKGGAGVQWNGTNDSALVVWGGSTVAARADGWPDAAVVLGVGGKTIGAVTVVGVVWWIVGNGSTLDASAGGIVMGFGEHSAGTAFNIDSSATGIRVALCDSMVVPGAAAVLALSGLAPPGSPVATPQPPWWTATVCGLLTPIVSPHSPAANVTSMRSCAAFTVTAGDALLFLSMLLGITDGDDATTVSPCGAALLDVLAAPRWGTTGWAALLLARAEGASWEDGWWRDGIGEWGWGDAPPPSAVGPAMSTAAMTATTIVLNFMTTKGATNVSTSAATVPLATNLRLLNATNAHLDDVTTTTATVLEQPSSTTTSTTPAVPAGAISAQVLIAVGTASSHVVFSTAVSALGGSPQSVSRGPQALRLLSLRAGCRTRLTNDALSSIEAPDPKQFVWVFDWAGSLVAGAVASSATLQLVTFALFALLKRVTCFQPRDRRRMARPVALLHVAATAYYGPNVASAAGAVLLSYGLTDATANAALGASPSTVVGVAATTLTVVLTGAAAAMRATA